MGKSYRNDAKNDKWRREKQRKNNPSQQWQKPERDNAGWDSHYEPELPDSRNDNDGGY